MNVREMQTKLSRWATEDSGHRFFDLYHLLFDKDWLMEAYKSVRTNAGARTAGYDGLNMSAFERGLDRQIERLQEELRSQTYEPQPVRRAFIPKSNGKLRPLGIPAIRDRIVQEALRMVLEPIYEADFSQYSYGFRPSRRTHDALQVVKIMTREDTKHFWVVEGDIASFFDEIDHERLERIVGRRIKDRKVRDLVWKFLKAGVMEEGNYRNTVSGTPQGGIISPLLANIYLNELDQFVKQWTEIPKIAKRQNRRKGRGNWMYVRYADDFVMLTNGTKESAVQMKEELRSFLSNELGLTLSDEKTRVTHVNDGFDFLGFHVERVVNGKDEKQTQITIPKASIEKFRETIYAATDRTENNTSVSTKLVALSRVVRGWGHYYKHCWSAATTFNRLDSFVWRQSLHWIAGKHRWSVRQTVREYQMPKSTIRAEGQTLARLRDIPTRPYFQPIFKPNPYLAARGLEREVLPEDQPWLGKEERPGFGDARIQALGRDNWTCQKCGAKLTRETAEVDHKKAVRQFKDPASASGLDNLQSLCIDCHKSKTHSRSRVESPVQ